MRVIIERVPEPLPPTPKEEARENRKEGRDRQNLWVQRIIAFFAFGYATVAIFQYCEMRRTNKLTSDALELSKKMFTATQTAGFACQLNSNIGTQMTVQISCNNRGKSAAGNVTGEIAFTRSERGIIVQQEKKPINERIILDGGGVYRFFFVTGTYNWEWMRKQDMTGSVVLNYGNGIENVSQSSCWRLLIRPGERSTTFTDCENYPETKKSAQ